MAYLNAIYYLDPESGVDTTRPSLTSVAVSNNGSGAVRCTKVAHGLISGAIGIASGSYTGEWKITRIDADTFDMIGSTYGSAVAFTFVPFGGSSKADAWKTISTGATAARIAPGDFIRIKASPDETLVSNASWTQNTKVVTLPDAVTATIIDCESAWVAATSVTSTTSTTRFKEGSKAISAVVAGAFTTGKIAHIGVDVGAINTLTNRTSNLLGPGTLPLIQSANVDDGSTQVTLPFNIRYNGVTYSTVFIGSNSYISFGAGSGVYSNLSASTPAIPNIMINGADRSTQRVYAGSEDSNLTYRVRVEGTSTSSGTPGSSTVFWEVLFTAANPGAIKLDIGANASSLTGTSGFSDGAGNYIAAFTEGTVNIGYTLTTTPNPSVRDLSAFQQISLWARTDVSIAANTLSLRLCTDTIGNVAAHTVLLPATAANNWIPLVFDLGVNMNSAITSVALYAEVDPVAVTINLDNIIACKASSSPDALTLNSLIGKISNLSWAPTTSYSLNEERRPTQPMRNGLQYQVLIAGISSGVEPIWPLEVGLTVVDGGITWNTQEYEDSWYAIQSISGTTVKIDNHVEAIGNVGRGYSGTTETIATYKREAFLTGSANANNITDTGTGSNPLTFSGGWNRTDMSTQTGETWFSGSLLSTGTSGCHSGSNEYLNIYNINLTRFDRGGNGNGGLLGQGICIYNCHWNNCGSASLNASGNMLLTATGCSFRNNGATGYTAVLAGTNAHRLSLTRVSFEGNLLPPWAPAATVNFNGIYSRNNAGWGVAINRNTIGYNLVTSSNSSGGIELTSKVQTISRSLIGESTMYSSLAAVGLAGNDACVYSEKHNQVADSHLITFDGGTIISAVDQRRTASGISWKFRPTSIIRSTGYPLKLSIAKIACVAGTPINASIYVRRDTTTITGNIKIYGGQIAGVPSNISVICQPSINTWAQSNALTFTPTETGVVEIMFEVHDGVSTTSNFWIDDLVVT